MSEYPPGFPIPLSRFEDLNYGEERRALPAAQLLVRENAVTFPVSAENLRPAVLRPLQISVPRFSHFSFPEATVHGFRLLYVNDLYCHDASLVGDGRMYFPATPASWANEDVDLNSPSEIRSKSGRRVSNPIEGAVFLGSDEPSNFGSWMYRVLPKILLSRDYLLERPLFVYCGSEWMQQIVNVAMPRANIIKHNPALSYALKDTIIPSLPAPFAFLRPEIQDLLTGLIDSLPRSVSAPERIYLSRRAQASRRAGFRVLQNEGELVDRLAGLGFVEFIPEEHSFEHQLSVISRAKVIVCPGGSGLFGCLFARSAEMIIDFEANDIWQQAHANILAASGRPFSMVLGQQPIVPVAPFGQAHSNWFIDVEALVEGIRLLGL